MKQLPPFTDITLVLTEQCNLRCAYCYVPKEAPGGRTMSEEVALAAVDRFLERAPANRSSPSPFLAASRFWPGGSWSGSSTTPAPGAPRG